MLSPLPGVGVALKAARATEHAAEAARGAEHLAQAAERAGEGAAHAAESAENAAKGVASGENLVYRSVNAAGEANYVGITNNLERRAAEHLSSKGIAIDGIPGLNNLSRADARAVEQTLIESHGLSKNGGTLMNKINSISTANPAYAGALQRGAELLKQAGYPGF